MPVATRTDSTLNPTITQTNLRDAIVTAHTNAGYGTAFDNYTASTDMFLVYRIIGDNTKLQGTTYLRTRISNTLQIQKQMYTDWNTSTKAGTNGGATTAAVTFATGSGINFYAFNLGTEGKLILMQQGTTFELLGHIRPENMPTWWDENSFPYCFTPTTNAGTGWISTLTTPYWSTTTLSSATFATSLGISNLGTANPQTGRRDLATGILLYGSTNGIACRTSNEIAQAAASGLNRLDIIQVTAGVEEYTVINNVAGGLCLRTI